MTPTAPDHSRAPVAVAVVVAVAIAAASLASGQTDPTDPTGGGIVTDPQIAALDFGVYCAPKPQDVAEAPGTVMGEVYIYDDTPDFRWRSREVPAVLGIGFGVLVTLADTGAPGPITHVTLHPAFAGNGAKQQTWVSQLAADRANFRGYRFDEPYELAVGTWTLEGWRDDTMLYSITFEVVPPSARPDIGCGDSLLS